MPVTLDETHDPARRSFVASANSAESEFPIQNLPLGVVAAGAGRPQRITVAIGDQVLDLAAAVPALHGLDGKIAEACRSHSLNALMALGPVSSRMLRRALSRALSADAGNPALEEHLSPRAGARLALPVEIGDFTDFYASIFHATNAGKMFRPDNPLLPNYKYVPVAYHSRTSSICVSGTPVKRPQGQRKPPNEPAPSFGPSRHLDFELELGIYVGAPSTLGSPVPIARAGEHAFGFCLLNDWSSRDIQAWEYQPLGPFLGKNFATTVSPWVVTADALAPFRTGAFARPAIPLRWLTSTMRSIAPKAALASRSRPISRRPACAKQGCRLSA
jgi:fumarylacetoacetase